MAHKDSTPPDPEELLTLPRAAKLIGVTRYALTQARRAGRLTVRLEQTLRGPVYVVRRGDLQAYMSDRRYNAADVPVNYTPPMAIKIAALGRPEESTEPLTEQARQLVLWLIEEVKGMGFTVPALPDDALVEAVRRVDHPVLLNTAAAGDLDALERICELHYLTQDRETRVIDQVLKMNALSP